MRRHAPVLRAISAFVTGLWRAFGALPRLESPDLVPHETGRLPPGEYRIEWPRIQDPFRGRSR